MRTALTSQPSANPIDLIVKSSVTFLIFRGDECEDVHEFIRNYKRADRLNGWNEVNLAV